MTTERDLRNQMAYARQEAIEEGRAEGLAEGLAEGRAKGRAEGRSEGRSEGRAEVALRMLDSGMDISLIAHLTELSIEEVSVLAVKR